MVRGFSYDDETGEVTFYNINEETGEPLLDSELLPENAARTRLITEPSKKYIKFPKSYSTKTKEFQTLKANILAGSNQISYRMFLILSIPVSILFPNFFVTMLMLIEMFLHVKCHKMNKTIKDSSVYYRSPFHAVTSVFCGVCRESASSSKVGQLQDQRRCRYDYIKGIAI